MVGPLHLSLDCNPIENLWHELKGFIRHEANPKNILMALNAFGQLLMWGHSVSNHPMDYTRPSQILMKLGILVDLDPTAPILKF